MREEPVAHPEKMQFRLAGFANTVFDHDPTWGALLVAGDGRGDGDR
jgi:hypothetical protein